MSDFPRLVNFGVAFVEKPNNLQAYGSPEIAFSGWKILYFLSLVTGMPKVQLFLLFPIYFKCINYVFINLYVENCL